MIIGREKEQKELLGLLEKEESQFCAVYGRRRTNLSTITPCFITYASKKMRSAMNIFGLIHTHLRRTMCGKGLLLNVYACNTSRK